MESPKESATRSSPSISFAPGNNAAIRAYPGMKRTTGTPKMIRRKESFSIRQML
jgi:hypothetical protein